LNVDPVENNLFAILHGEGGKMFNISTFIHNFCESISYSSHHPNK